MRDIGLIILGSILALITSFTMVWVQTWIHERRTRRLLRDLLSNEIHAINEFIELLLNETPLRGFIPIQRLSEIQNARQGYDRNRDWMILFGNDALRRDVFNFYGRLNITCGEAQGLEAWALYPQNVPNPMLVGQIATRRQALVAAFQDLLNLGRNIVTRLEHN